MSLRTWITCTVLVISGCGGEDGTSTEDPVRGPADAMIELDVAAIPAPTPDAAPTAKDSAVTPADVELRCVGSATPCGLLAKTLCDLSLGCTRDKSCTGYPGSCYSQSDSYSCTRIKGCYWSSYSKNCSGSATPCSLYSDDYSCTSQKNCSFRDECTGTPWSCNTMPITSCLSQAGCRID